MKKLMMIVIATSLLSSCNLYKKYKRPKELEKEELFGKTIAEQDTTTLATIPWRSFFKDPLLQGLIEKGLAHNTDLEKARLQTEQTEAMLKAANLSFLPGFYFTPQGGVNSLDNNKPVWTYNLPVTASWEIDVFGKLRNKNRQARAAFKMSDEYRQAVQVKLIGTIANLYYTLLMLDEQLNITLKTEKNWEETVIMMEALKEAGLQNATAVSQTIANYNATKAATFDLKRKTNEVQNTLCLLIKEVPHSIKRGKIAEQKLAKELTIGLSSQLLSNRPDVRAAELSLSRYYYGVNVARSAFYPSLKLTGSAGWTNNAGMVFNSGMFLANAMASLTQPIFNKGLNVAQLKVAKAKYEAAKLDFQQTLLKAGNEVNNALTQCQTAQNKEQVRLQQIKALERTVESTQLLMKNTPVTYLQVITAQQALLQAQLTQVADWFEGTQGVVNLYQSLGGGKY